jgi:hypothetical protein
VTDISPSLRRSVVLVLAFLFGAALIVLSLAPINRIAVGTRPGYAASASAVHHAAVFHIAVHVFIFAAAACVAWLAAWVLSDDVVGKLLAVVTTLLFGCGTEYLEHAASRQPIELNDVFTNVAASGVMFVVLAGVESYRRRVSTSGTLP